MSILTLLAALNLFTSSLALTPQIPISPPSTEPLGSHTSHARENAPHIFNTIHSALRQWGSSLHHNGMSFFPASIPAHTLLYHGTRNSTPPEGMEWLAFEIEHAEMFAAPRMGRRPPRSGDPPPPPGQGGPGHPPPLASAEDFDRIGLEDEEPHGFLHIYRTSKELSNLVYIDGQSAAKSSLGTLDTQDLILRNTTSEPSPWNDYTRARDLCTLFPLLEGFIRMEAGFELILCNFTEGVEIVDVVQRSQRTKDVGEGRVDSFEYMRAVAMRYMGIMAGRIRIDYSSMTSAYFYGLNLTNPDVEKQGLPRLPEDNKPGLERVKKDLLDALARERSRGVDWQGVVDMIVTRYSDRLAFLISNSTTEAMMAADLNVLLDLFIDYGNANLTSSLQKCANHYLRPVSPVTPQDHLIHEAISTVTNRICTTLFNARAILEENDADKLQSAKLEVQKLTKYLDWTTWLECGKCPYDEVCFVAIWPWGTEEDHVAPKCRPIGYRGSSRGYWGGFGGPPDRHE